VVGEIPEPGAYADVSFDDYAAWPAVNHSILRHFRKTAAHVRHEMESQDESSKHQELGRAVHTAVLEPGNFESEFVVKPKMDRRTKAGKAAWAIFEKEAGGRRILTEEEWAVCEGIMRSIEKHPTARAFLRGKGVNELSLLWRDQEFDLLCKARLDRLLIFEGHPYILDVKTMHKPASTHAFQVSVESYQYHSQGAFYLRGAQQLQPAERRFAWLACETEPPHLVRLFDADDEALKIGADEVASWLQRFKECTESGTWPGWGDGMDIAGLPPWVMKRFNIE
jgi:exodeoxyribonuclease VIII